MTSENPDPGARNPSFGASDRSLEVICPECGETIKGGRRRGVHTGGPPFVRLRGDGRHPRGEDVKPFTVPHFRAWSKGLVLDSGEPWELEPFQAAFVGDVFRGYLESWLVIPEGNAKTTLAAALCLYHAQFKPAAMVTVAASSRNQAAWLYLAAAGFVMRSPSIERVFKCQEGFRRIRCDSVGSRVQVFAADDRTGDGAMPTLAVLEELHRHRTLRLYRTWRGKIEKRHGQVVAILDGRRTGRGIRGSPFSDAFGSDREGRQRRAYPGGIEGLRLARIRGAGRAIPDVMRDVKAANPLKAITTPQLKRKHASPAMTPNHWRRFVCGLPAGLEDQPISAEEWDRARVDIGQVEDGEAVVLVPSVGHNAAIAIAAGREDGRVAIRVEVLEPGEASILVRTEDRLQELAERYEVLGVHHPLGAFVRSADLLASKGLPMVQAPHSPVALAAASGTFDRLLHSGGMMHDGDPTFRAHALSATRKSSETGERYEMTDRSRGLIAAVFAAHAVSAQAPTPVIFLPSEVIG